jgi:anti-sigma factor RsiW
MTVPDEEVFAFVDGELPPEAMARIEAAMATDPQLALRVETQRALRRLLSGPHGVAFASASALPDAPAPQAPPKVAEVIAFPGAQAKAKPKPKPKPRPPKASPSTDGLGRMSWIAMTACLAVGLVVGRFAAPSPPTLNGVDDVQPLAAGPLAQALNTLASGQAAGPVRIALSFQDASGRYCRAFQASGGPAPTAGVACREPAGWRVRAVSPAEPPGGGTPASVMAAVNTMMAGQPLDAAGEARAKAAGWKPAPGKAKGAAPR